MYLPPYSAQTDLALLRTLIADYPLGTLVTLGGDGLDANHIPFLLDTRQGEHGTLIGHVARNNALWRDHDPAIDALVIFQGPTAYISPNWYPTKQATHEVVPTYNYAVVHAHGPLIVHEDEKWLRGVVGKLTKTMEADQAEPWRMADAPRAFINEMLTQIVGIEIPIRRLTGKWKASQNRPAVDRTGAIAGLRATGDAEARAMAGVMEESVPA